MDLEAAIPFLKRKMQVPEGSTFCFSVVKMSVLALVHRMYNSRSLYRSDNLPVSPELYC